MSSSFEENPIDLNFESLFKTVNCVLRANLAHPKIRKDFWWFCKFGILFSIFSSVACLLLYSTYSYDLKNADYTQACANGIICFVYFVVAFSYCIIFTYKNLLDELIDRMDTDYQLANNLPKEERAIVLKFARKGQGVAKLWLIVSCGACGLFITKQIFLTVYYSITSEFRLVHLYEFTYPDAIEQVKDNLTIYCILYIYFFYYDIFATLMFIGFIPMGSIFMLHACGQLELAKTRILTVFHENNSCDDINKKLKDVALFLNTTYRFVDWMQLSFKVLYELTLKTTSLVLPITLYQILASSKNGDLRVEFISIFFGAIVLSSVPCYYSDVLMESGEKVRLAVYSSGWETHWERKSRIMILMLLQRTSRPVAIRTMFRNVCLDALADVFHQAYAIFNLINAAWN